MNNARKTLIPLVLAATFAAATSHADAGSVTAVTARAPNEAVSVTVSFEDLDLASAKGQETLHYRLTRAAKTVCGSSDLRSTGNLTVAVRNAECQEVALARALSKVNAAALVSVR